MACPTKFILKENCNLYEIIDFKNRAALYKLKKTTTNGLWDNLVDSFSVSISTILRGKKYFENNDRKS